MSSDISETKYIKSFPNIFCNAKNNNMQKNHNLKIINILNYSSQTINSMDNSHEAGLVKNIIRCLIPVLNFKH